MAPAAKNPPVSATQSTDSSMSFEAAMAELEALVEKMENGQLPLEASLTAYQRGTELLKYCETVLKDAEQKIKVLDNGTLKDYEKQA
ncbi:MAG: exodeoxyribonuclease VII small subunit [Betaproteobacteria bacterium]|nr:exodeoxyribonuclease VII small subunit [Betaproteobacteria bacterium]